jgi:predicted phage terminase large subunit-like protein
MVRFEREPGSASVRDAQRMIGMLPRLDVAGISSQEDKITRAKPFAAQCKAGNVKLKRGAWNETWLHHMHNQPELPHDDIMDASVGAYDDLTAEYSNVVHNVG